MIGPIGIGLIAMWITYAATGSVGLAWGAFFVAGGLAFGAYKNGGPNW